MRTDTMTLNNLVLSELIKAGDGDSHTSHLSTPPNCFFGVPASNNYLVGLWLKIRNLVGHWELPSSRKNPIECIPISSKVFFFGTQPFFPKTNHLTYFVDIARGENKSIKQFVINKGG